MHPKNLHNNPYQFDLLQKSNPLLREYVFVNDYKNTTIDFSNAKAVKELNKALLSHHYGIKNWDIPDGYLCPPIPGRVDYIHYIADIVGYKKEVKGLDIGVGANCIYPLLGTKIYEWTMVGVDSNEASVVIAKENVVKTATHSTIDIRFQKTPAYIFEDIIQEGEFYDFTMCNPPFYNSAQEAQKANHHKNIKLQLPKNENRNFGGLSNELWCNGGEALFVKRMIKQSVGFKKQVHFFTTLISRKENLPKLLKQLTKLKAFHTVIDMQQGHKKSRLLVWSFTSEIHL